MIVTHAAGKVLKLSETEDLALLVYKTFFLGMLFTTKLQCFLFAITGNLSNCFNDLYDQLSVVQQKFQDLKTPTRRRMLSTILVAQLVFAFIFSLALVIPLSFDHDNQKLDPIFTSVMLNRGNTTNTLHDFSSIFPTFWRIFVLGSIIYISLEFAYFNSMVFMIFMLFRSFNQQLEQQIKHSPVIIKQKMGYFSQAHYELCKLVEAANKLFRLSLFTKICAHSVGVLYQTTIGVAEESSTRVIMICWCVMLSSLLYVIIVICQTVQDKDGCSCCVVSFFIQFNLHREPKIH